MGAPEPRQKTKEPTREEMLAFVRSEINVRPVAIEDVKDFIRKKYGDNKFVAYLLSGITFDYVRDYSLSLRAESDLGESKLNSPEYSFGWNNFNIVTLIRTEHPVLNDEYTNLINTKNFAVISEKLLKALYAVMQKQKKELEGEKIKERIIEATDHEFGHFILYKIQTKKDNFGIEYEEIAKHFTQLMRKKQELLARIAMNYISLYSQETIAKVIKRLEDDFFGPIEKPEDICPNGKKIFEEIAETGISSEIIIAVSSKEISPRITKDMWERLSERLGENDLRRLKSEAKTVSDLDGRIGLGVQIDGSESRGTWITVTYSKEGHMLVKKHGLTPDQYFRFSKLLSCTAIRERLIHELFARSLDSLTDGEVQDNFEKLRPGITHKDLEFFSRFVFEGEPMFDVFIKSIEQKMKKATPRKIEEDGTDARRKRRNPE
ncbi:MAG: hypothetical protein AABW86_02715 [Candidatus Micrarchaeota archaeon]